MAETRKSAHRSRARKKAKKGTWGGARPGAGRPKGSGRGPSPHSRRNRVAVMFTDQELRVLSGLSRRKRIPMATAAYQLIVRSLYKG